MARRPYLFIPYKIYLQLILRAAQVSTSSERRIRVSTGRALGIGLIKSTGLVAGILLCAIAANGSPGPAAIVAWVWIGIIWAIAGVGFSLTTYWAHLSAARDGRDRRQAGTR